MLQEQEYVHRANEYSWSSNQQVVNELIAGYEGGTQYESRILTGAAFQKDGDEGDLEEPKEEDHGKWNASDYHFEVLTHVLAFNLLK